MVSTSRLAQRRSRRTGLLICAAALALAAAFGFGLWRGSYWALAIPVALGVAASLGLAFSIGWTIATVRGIPPQAEPYSGRAARWGAWTLCAASLALALAFAVGLARQSYWAVALPVALAVFGLLAMTFQIGWAVIRRRDTLPLKEARERARDAEEREAAARLKALAAAAGDEPRA